MKLFDQNYCQTWHQSHSECNTRTQPWLPWIPLHFFKQSEPSYLIHHHFCCNPTTSPFKTMLIFCIYVRLGSNCSFTPCTSFYFINQDVKQSVLCKTKQQPPSWPLSPYPSITLIWSVPLFTSLMPTLLEPLSYHIWLDSLPVGWSARMDIEWASSLNKLNNDE